MPKKQLSEIEILNIYKNTGLFPSDTAFANEIGVSRQTLSQWLSGVHTPSLSWLKMTALLHRDNWRSMLAVDLLKARGLSDEIPCGCVEGVQGPCPLHYPLTDFLKGKTSEEVKA